MAWLFVLAGILNDFFFNQNLFCLNLLYSVAFSIFFTVLNYVKDLLASFVSFGNDFLIDCLLSGVLGSPSSSSR